MAQLTVNVQVTKTLMKCKVCGFVQKEGIQKTNYCPEYGIYLAFSPHILVTRKNGAAEELSTNGNRLGIDDGGLGLVVFKFTMVILNNCYE